MIERPVLLMTRPTHYDVAYEINPWMKPEVWRSGLAANRAAALGAWTGLRQALESNGAQVRVMEGAPGVPDLVFPANAAVILGRKALPARFRHPERRAEEPHFQAALESLKAAGVIDEIAGLETGFQEGAGDCLWDAGRQLFWVASGPRSTPDSVGEIARVFGREVVHMPLASARYYHLDTCFCPLSGGEILYHPPALTDAALAALVARTRPEQRIEANAEEAEAFCVNAVSIGRTLVMARPPASLAARLAHRGYRVVPVDLEPFMLSGGGAFCMTLRLDLHADPALAPRVAA